MGFIVHITWDSAFISLGLVTADGVLHEEEKLIAPFKSMVDMASALIGLETSPQLVVREMDNGFFDDVESSYEMLFQTDPSPIVYAPVPIDITHESIISSVTVLQSVPSNLKLALRWLYRSWSEGEPIYRFICLFTSIECLLQGYTGPRRQAIVDAAARLHAFIGSFDIPEREELDRCVDTLEGDQRGVPLVTRFRTLITEIGRADTEAIVHEFSGLNQIRNRIVHLGRDEVKTAASEIEDIVQICIRWCLANSGNSE